jgi:hypothetical protein
VIALPVLLLAGLLVWAMGSVWRTRQVRSDASAVLAAMAAEAPCEALGHVRIVPADEGLTVEGLDEDDVYVRIMRALDLFAEESGFDVPVPVVWLAIASVVATAILGEDLAAVLRGPGQSK